VLKKYRLAGGLLLPLLLLGAAACGEGRPSLILGATTSTYDSGLLEALMQEFGDAHPEFVVRTIVVGSGEALELGRRGDVDLLLVHAPAAEKRFVEQGLAKSRTALMSNQFVIVGPGDDPAGIGRIADPAPAFAAIARQAARFISRGDSSGTHERELALWRRAGLTPERPWYLESGQGQGTTLQIASERQAYALTDRATFDVLSDILDLVPLVDGHPDLLNAYSVIVPVRAVHSSEAETLAGWLTSDAGLRAIRNFRLPGASRPLFVPTSRESGGAGSDSDEAGSGPADPAPIAEDSVTPVVTPTR
jgi:tungstate transport system substrate-binding protein